MRLSLVPVRWVGSNTKKLSVDENSENRSLQVLFMASSPLNIKPVLDFEAEEGRILEATKRHQSLALTVEESGYLVGLGDLIKYYGKGYFDVLHLNGHASITDGQPRFVTETITGEAYYATAKEIAKQLKPATNRSKVASVISWLTPWGKLLNCFVSAANMADGASSNCCLRTCAGSLCEN